MDLKDVTRSLCFLEDKSSEVKKMIEITYPGSAIHGPMDDLTVSLRIACTLVMGKIKEHAGMFRKTS